jgi:hypothetical protein
MFPSNHRKYLVRGAPLSPIIFGYSGIRLETLFSYHACSTGTTILPLGGKRLGAMDHGQKDEW